MKNYESWWSRKIVKPEYTTIENFKRVLDRNKSRYEYLKLVEEIAPETILDAGCGLGLDYEMYREKYPHIKCYGLDITKGFIMENKRNYPEADFMVARIQDIPLKNSSIDLVTCRAVLEHIPEPEPAIRELARVAKKNVAIIWFIIPGKEEDIRITQSGFYRNTYTEQRIVKSLKKNGLEFCYITVVEDKKSVNKMHEMWVLRKV